MELIGSYLGQYWLTDIIGRGSTSTVYKAYQPSLGRYVAVKVLRSIDPQFAVRFRREAKAIAHLQHPNILPIFDYDEHEGLSYFVLPYVENNTTLADLLTGQPVEPLIALQLMMHVLDGLAYAHSRGVIHRDIKPANILMTSPNWPVLADFGIAKLVDETSQLTPPGQTVGTAIYMAPERAQGKHDDERGDLYSAGVVLYEMLTGRVPFNAKTPLAVVTKHMYEAPPAPRSLNPQLPPVVERAVLRALEKDPQARYQTAGEMRAALQQVVRQLEADSVGRSPAGSEAPAVVSYETRKLVPDAPPTHLPPPAPRVTTTLPARGAQPHAGLRRRGLIAAFLLGLVAVLALLLFVGLRDGGKLFSSPALGLGGTTPTLPSTAVAGIFGANASPTSGAANPNANTLPAPAPSPAGEPAAPAATSTATAYPTAVLGEMLTTALPTAELLEQPTALPTAETLPPTPIPPTPVPPTRLPPTPVPPTATNPPPAPTMGIAAEPTPVAVPPTGSQTLRLDDTAWQGGYGGPGNPKVYGGRTATWTYGQGTAYQALRAAFRLAVQPTGTATLTIEGMDSEDAAKTAISIEINGTQIFQGANPLPDDDVPLESGTWSSATWTFDPALLQTGQNEIVIRNLAQGTLGRPPFFMLDYAELTYPVG